MPLEIYNDDEEQFKVYNDDGAKKRNHVAGWQDTALDLLLKVDMLETVTRLNCFGGCLEAICFLNKGNPATHVQFCATFLSVCPRENRKQVVNETTSKI